MPEPRKGETKSDYINRCTKQLIEKENRKPDQARAICESMWKNRDKKKKGANGQMNTESIPLIMDSVINIPWAITKDKLQEIMFVLQTKNIDTELFETLKNKQVNMDIWPDYSLDSSTSPMYGPTNPASKNEEKKPYSIIEGGVAVIPIIGTLSKRMNIIGALSGGTSYELIQQQIKMAMEDVLVKAVFMHMDTPGGNVDGLFNTADLIYNSRGNKPILAYADGTMASAGYLLGSAADYVVISDRAAHVGSIGVIAVHLDKSARYAKEGIKPTIFSSGGYKKTGNEYEAISNADRRYIQSQLDIMFSLLVDAIAINRNMASESMLANGLANGGTYIGQEAVDIGLADEILNKEQAIERLKEMI